MAENGTTERLLGLLKESVDLQRTGVEKFVERLDRHDESSRARGEESERRICDAVEAKNGDKWAKRAPWIIAIMCLIGAFALVGVKLSVPNVGAAVDAPSIAAPAR